MKTVIAFVTLCIATALSKKCYSCSYNFPTLSSSALNIPASDNNCADPFVKEGTTVPTQDCSSNCYKLKAEASGTQVVIRGCGSIVGTSYPCTSGSYDQGGVSGSLSCCSGDMCNSASGLRITSGLALVMLIAAFLSL